MCIRDRFWCGDIFAPHLGIYADKLLCLNWSCVYILILSCYSWLAGTDACAVDAIWRNGCWLKLVRAGLNWIGLDWMLHGWTELHAGLNWQQLDSWQQKCSTVPRISRRALQMAKHVPLFWELKDVSTADCIAHTVSSFEHFQQKSKNISYLESGSI